MRESDEGLKAQLESGEQQVFAIEQTAHSGFIVVAGPTQEQRCRRGKIVCEIEDEMIALLAFGIKLGQ